jgi:hypothetical protein
MISSKYRGFPFIYDVKKTIIVHEDDGHNRISVSRHIICPLSCDCRHLIELVIIIPIFGISSDAINRNAQQNTLAYTIQLISI